MPGQAFAVEAEGDCPTKAAVEEALAPLFESSSSSVTASGARVVVRDLGAEYEVQSGKVARHVLDMDRRCAERAQAAAVIAMLAIAPPTVPARESSSPDSPHPNDFGATRTEVPAPSFAPEAHPRAIDLEAFFVYGVSSLGGGARVALTGETIGLALGLRSTSPSRQDVGHGARAGIQRSQADLALRWGSGQQPVEVAFELGVAADLLVIEGQGLPVTRGATRFEPGLRGAASLRVWVLDAMALTVGAEAFVTLWPTPIVVDPLGRVGETGKASVWGVAGMLMRFD
jgi:hypothetical protein